MLQYGSSHRRPGALFSTATLVSAALACLVAAGSVEAGVDVWTGGGPNTKAIYAYVVDTANPSTMYAGALGSGVYKSTNGGALWNVSTTGLTNTYIRALAIYPQNHSILFAGTNDGVEKSTDAGITWTQCLALANSVRGLAFDATNPYLVYAGSLGQGVYKSSDLGATWAAVNNGLGNHDVRTLAAHPLVSGTLLAGAGTGGGVYMSTTGGLFWTQVADTIAQGAVNDIEYDPLSASRVYAGMFERGVLRSLDGGTHWTRTASGLTSWRVRALDLADTLRYVGTDTSGVFFSTLNGAGWQARDNGLPNLMIRALEANPVAPLSVYAGTDGAGVYHTADGGLSWSPLNTRLTDVACRVVLLRHDVSRTLMCGTGFGDGIWRSTDGAASWVRETTLDSRNSVLDLKETAAGDAVYAAIYGSGVYKSIDGGITWLVTPGVLPNLFVRELSIHPANGLDVIAGTGDGPYHTTDGGLTWTHIATGFPAAASVRALSRDPLFPNVLLAGTDSSGVFRTTDGGTNWAAVSAGLTDPYIHVFAIDPSNHNRVLAGADAGLFVSTNGGQTWAAIGTGLPASPSVRAIAFDRSRPARVFAGLYGQGVYRSEDGGVSWVAMNNGLPNRSVYSLGIDAATHTLYCGTRLRGVWAMTYSGTGVAASGGLTSDPVAGLRISAMHPNPVRGACEIVFDMAATGPGAIAIYDVRGTLVRDLDHGVFSSGEHHETWDGRDSNGRPVASGLYLVRLSAGGGSLTAKMMVTR